MAIITKRLALAIAKKLDADMKEGRRHVIAVVSHEGKQVASFGIRRGSRPDASHDHVPQQVYLRPRDAKLLGLCPMSLDDWLEVLRAKGLIS